MPRLPADPDAPVRAAAQIASEALAALTAAMEQCGMPDTEGRAVERLRRGIVKMATNPRGSYWREVHGA